MKTLLTSIQVIIQLSVVAVCLAVVSTVPTSTPNCDAPGDVDINLTAPFSVLIDTDEMPNALAYQFKIIINGFCPFVITQYKDEHTNPNAFTHGINPIVQMIEVRARILCTNNEFTEWTEKETLIINN